MSIKSILSLSLSLDVKNEADDRSLKTQFGHALILRRAWNQRNQEGSTKTESRTQRDTLTQEDLPQNMWKREFAKFAMETITTVIVTKWQKWTWIKCRNCSCVLIVWRTNMMRNAPGWNGLLCANTAHLTRTSEHFTSTANRALMPLNKSKRIFLHCFILAPASLLLKGLYCTALF